jgi:hypothetical protein
VSGFDQGIERTTTDPPMRVRVVVVEALRCTSPRLARGVFAGNGVLEARGLTAPDPLAKTEA